MSFDDDVLTRRAQARVGQTLRGKWRLERLLGVGGMASVYEATHRNGKRGAVKMLHLELSLDQAARERFLREGYVANSVEHPGVVSVLDDDQTDDGSVFLVMELLEGESMEARRDGRPTSRLEVGEVIAMADQLLDVLDAAHARGVVHRDLKPDNLFMTRHGQLKVLDFGIARLRELSNSSGATRTGHMMGTPTFMPPEQARGDWKDVDARSDLWAVGATMFTLLTGRTVHQADTLNKMLLAAMTAPAPPIASVMPAIPPAVAAVIDRSLAFERDARWSSARDMRAALQAARAQPVVAAPTRPSAGVALAMHPAGPGSVPGSFPYASAPPTGLPPTEALSGMPPSRTRPSATLSAAELHGGAPAVTMPQSAVGHRPSVPFASTAAPVSATLAHQSPPRRTGMIVGSLVALGVIGGGAALFAALGPGNGPEASAARESVAPAESASEPAVAPAAPPAADPAPAETPAATGAAAPASAASAAPAVPGGAARPSPRPAPAPTSAPRASASSGNPFDRW